MNPPVDNAQQPRRVLSVLDGSCIIAGVIIGVGIFETTPTVAGALPSGGWILALWLVGGLLALSGGLCYAELASAWPREGGDVVYLTRAYGGWAGHLFGWGQMLVIRPGDIALMAFVFGRYASVLLPTGPTLSAALAVVVLTAVNIAGVRQGKWTQNILTGIKVLGLLLVVAAALFAGPAAADASPVEPLGMGGLNLALILVLFTYGGWSEMAYVAAEVRTPGRSIVRAIVLGIGSVTAIYLAVNGAFLYTVGRSGMAGSEAIAVDTVRAAIPSAAGEVIAVLICISALGAINGLVLTGARISYAMGTDHAPYRLLGRWSRRASAPVPALVLQGLITLGIVFLLGSFEKTILYTAPMVWLFFLATGVALFVLRRKEPSTERPYRTWGYPVTPILFCLSCAFLVYSSIAYAVSQAMVAPLVAAGIILLGLPVYAVWLKGTNQPG